MYNTKLLRELQQNSGAWALDSMENLVRQDFLDYLTVALFPKKASVTRKYGMKHQNNKTILILAGLIGWHLDVAILWCNEYFHFNLSTN